jgi:hypothetical protein
MMFIMIAVTKDDIKEKRFYWTELYGKNGVATKQTFKRFAERIAVEYDDESVEFMFRAMEYVLLYSHTYIQWKY